jgi:hypothetical protein
VQQARAIKRWHCPVCQAVDGQQQPLEATAERLARLRRPLPLRLLRGLLQDALLLGVEMPEERLVAAVLAEYAGWQVRERVSWPVLRP